jgi:methionine synthase I (cobalamin-dependent)
MAGAIGPLDSRLSSGKMGREEAHAFREQVQALVIGGADLFILETFRDLTKSARRSGRSAVCAACRSWRR